MQISSQSVRGRPSFGLGTESDVEYSLGVVSVSVTGCNVTSLGCGETMSGFVCVLINYSHINFVKRTVRYVWTDNSFSVLFLYCQCLVEYNKDLHLYYRSMSWDSYIASVSVFGRNGKMQFRFRFLSTSTIKFVKCILRKVLRGACYDWARRSKSHLKDIAERSASPSDKCSRTVESVSK